MDAPAEARSGVLDRGVDTWELRAAAAGGVAGGTCWILQGYGCAALLTQIAACCPPRGAPVGPGCTMAC